MRRTILAVRILIGFAAMSLALVIWLAASPWEKEKLESPPLVLQELARSKSAEKAAATSDDNPAGEYERLLAAMNPPFDRSPPEDSPDLKKRFLKEIARAVLDIECVPTSHWNSAMAFSDGVPFAVPAAYHDGYLRLVILLKRALRVLGPDAVRTFGPALFARQLCVAVEDGVYPPLAETAANALQDAGFAEQVQFPRLRSNSAERSHAAMRAWWLERARANGWVEELRVVHRMMTERGIRPDGTGAGLEQRCR
jgi:hypothetical protein